MDCGRDIIKMACFNQAFKSTLTIATWNGLNTMSKLLLHCMYIFAALHRKPIPLLHRFGTHNYIKMLPYNLNGKFTYLILKNVHNFQICCIVYIKVMSYHQHILLLNLYNSAAVVCIYCITYHVQCDTEYNMTCQ